MSDVRRYEFDDNGVCYHQPDGPFVSYDDYARLKAEVERLRKAGDAMYNGYIRIYGGHVGNLAEEYTAEWNAAKETPPHA